jgi:hypothetical protein
MALANGGGGGWGGGVQRAPQEIGLSPPGGQSAGQRARGQRRAEGLLRAVQLLLRLRLELEQAWGNKGKGKGEMGNRNTRPAGPAARGGGARGTRTRAAGEAGVRRASGSGGERLPGRGDSDRGQGQGHA